MTKRSLLSQLPEQKPDPLLDLIKKFAGDPRSEKIDLGVGVYRDENGHTPVMAAVKAAEQFLWETQTTKSYIGPEGDPEFIKALAGQVFGERRDSKFVGGVQTPGGTGGLEAGRGASCARRSEADLDRHADLGKSSLDLRHGRIGDEAVSLFRQ